MADPTTGNGRYPLPAQSTSPPDVVRWLTDGLQSVDDHLTTADRPIGHILSGPVASLPAALAPGQIYAGW
jgi:hypothetical protein